MDVRYAIHPSDLQAYDTSSIRARVLVEDLMTPGRSSLAYTHHDRVLIAGVVPLAEPILLDAGALLGSNPLLERREIGIVNVGGPGTVQIDGVIHRLARHDFLYAGRGSLLQDFSSASPDEPARFYCVSATAHADHPTMRAGISDAEPLLLGSPDHSNERALYQIIHPDGVQACQLMMGLTVLRRGSVWNTMPPHLHDSRTEIYFYHDMEVSDRVFHLMGLPESTRHVVIANEQAVISPGWSIHAGAGTGGYAFIWAMAGENQSFEDVTQLDIQSLV